MLSRRGQGHARTAPAAVRPPRRSTGTTDADLTGAGATFPYPIYSKWFADYAAKTGVKINYQSIGSGGGIRQLSEQTVDFGASRRADDRRRDGEGEGRADPAHPDRARRRRHHVQPSRRHAAAQAHRSGLADIFLGKITKWNDARIAALNAGVDAARDATSSSCIAPTAAARRYIFTDYLSAVSPAWKAGPGKGKEVQWPVGLGGKGNDGVAGQVKQTPGAIGYVELAYAKQNKLPTAAFRTPPASSSRRRSSRRPRRRRGGARSCRRTPTTASRS